MPQALSTRKGTQMPVPYSAAADALAEYSQRRREREMREALKADGEKLRQLTGQDHGPEFFDTCPACDGDGSIECSRPQHDDPYFAVAETCSKCNGSGWIEAMP